LESREDVLEQLVIGLGFLSGLFTPLGCAAYGNRVFLHPLGVPPTAITGVPPTAITGHGEPWPLWRGLLSPYDHFRMINLSCAWGEMRFIEGEFERDEGAFLIDARSSQAPLGRRRVRNYESPCETRRGGYDSHGT
jgi:hypothetical protein